MLRDPQALFLFMLLNFLSFPYSIMSTSFFTKLGNHYMFISESFEYDTPHGVAFYHIPYCDDIRYHV